MRKAGRLALGGRRPQENSPPVLLEPRRFPYGPFRFKIQLGGRRPFTVLASTDLVNWTPIATESSGSESQEYVDSEAPKFSHRFYRVFAGNVASTAVLGYASISLPPGFSLIANPFHQGNNVVADAFKGWPKGTTLNKFDAVLLRLTENTLKDGQWTNPSQTLAPGEGAIFFNPTEEYKTHSFIGEVAQGALTLPIPSGFSLRSSMVPKAGNLLDDLKFPVADGDVIHLFDRDRQKYALHAFNDGRWQYGAPLLGIGEAFWVAKADPENWNQHLVLGSHISAD